MRESLMSENIYMSAKAWPFEQAREILKRLDIEKKRGIERGDKPVIFETGYGPSGLPHIGTFGEVVRTSMVMDAFAALTDNKIPMKMICVSDDLDGMRKVPGNMPNQEMLTEHLGKPLTDVPDPFGLYDSFAGHNNAKLREFLDGFGFTYEFKSATDLYKSGAYDAMLLKALEKFDDIMKVMLPTLGEERQATYSPFLPISPKSGALNVDFEMFGKDHQINSKIYSRICKILGAQPPVQYVYELFLDDKGEKISKSKGNGISVEEWLSYATPQSLALYMYNKPRVAKRLYFDVIPRAMDEYFQHLSAYHRQEPEKQIANPVWFIHNGNPPKESPPISFALMLNLVSAAPMMVKRCKHLSLASAKIMSLKISETGSRLFTKFVSDNPKALALVLLWQFMGQMKRRPLSKTPLPESLVKTPHPLTA